jgi:hypothetical protein
LISSVASQMVEVELKDASGTESVFIHKHLLYERSKNLRTWVDEAPAERDRIVIQSDLKFTAFKRFAGWGYGQPMLVPNEISALYCEEVLEDLADIHCERVLEDRADMHDLCLDPNEGSRAWDTECVHACLDGIEQILAQTAEVPSDPIRRIQSVLKERDEHPGRSKFLKHLVYGVCANDGRTKEWLDEYRRNLDCDS